MEHSPPPFFNRGPAPLVRLFFFASLSLALLVLDARFRYAEGLRSVLALAAYPLQRVATAPIDLGEGIAGYFSNQSQLLEENARAARQGARATRSDAQRYQAAEAEAAQLRRLIGAAERLPCSSQPAEVLYAGRDPYSHKVVIDNGATHGVRPGSPVVDEAGVIGQVTRVHPLLSEVTLLTDKDQAMPVQVVRNGLRAVAFGGGALGMLELRFMAANAEIQNGDRLVTSGIDGTYPPGLPVATVVRIERDAAYALRARRLPARRRRRPRPLRAGAGRRGARARRGPRKRSRARTAAARSAAPSRGDTQGSRWAPIARAAHPAAGAREHHRRCRSPLALLLNFLPWSDLRLVPDFVALVLVLLVRAPAAPGRPRRRLDARPAHRRRQRRAARPARARLLGARLPRDLAVAPHPVVPPGLQALHVAALLLVAAGRRRCWCAWPPAPAFPAGRSSSARSSAPRSGRW